jgi:transcription initiation factor TFIIIB Brf1 subunit/transcription initiation factor TFIIB
MSNSEHCPNCGSDAIIYITEQNHAFCKDCHNGWEINAPQPPPTINVSLSKANHPQIKTFCKNLANSTDWLDKIANNWPAPIAHEYHRLNLILVEKIM